MDGLLAFQTPAYGVSFHEMHKILIFEDEDLLAGMLETQFALAGFEVKRFTHPPANVVDVVAQERPDIISMSVIMPEMDGYTATRLLKTDRRTRDIPLFFLTSVGQQADIQRGMALGAAEYLVKSQHTPGDVLDRAQKLLAESARLRRGF